MSELGAPIQSRRIESQDDAHIGFAFAQFLSNYCNSRMSNCEYLKNMEFGVMVSFCRFGDSRSKRCYHRGNSIQPLRVVAPKTQKFDVSVFCHVLGDEHVMKEAKCWRRPGKDSSFDQLTQTVRIVILEEISREYC